MNAPDLKLCSILLISYKKPNFVEDAISWSEGSSWEHATNIVQIDPIGLVVEAETTGVKENPLAPYLTPSFRVGVLSPIIPFTPEEQARIIAAWKSRLGDNYGFQDIAWLASLEIARKLGLPSVKDFDPLADSDRPICSELSCIGWEAGRPHTFFNGWNLGDITPADLANGIPGTSFVVIQS